MEKIRDILLKVHTLAVKTCLSLKYYGAGATLKKIWQKLTGKRKWVYVCAYPKEEELNRQRNFTFPRSVMFSILTPLYNTNEKFLEDMLVSVTAQTYGNWELCLADGSDDEYRYVEAMCRGYAEKDSRIKYLKLEENEGISGNTNHCIDMATGDYITLLDHDDCLHICALFQLASVINEQNADFIYTDECIFNKTPYDACLIHYKPDYAPDNLRANNYICHLTAFSKELLNKAGWFQKHLDGSQDHDMVLRLTEQAENIAHIPKVLYFWRSHKHSVAGDAGSKDYTHASGRKAIEDHLGRVGLFGTVEDTFVSNIHRIRYKITDEPLISILIPNKDNIDELDICLRSIKKLTTYDNYEIIVIENNSEEKTTFAYYEEKCQGERVKVVYWSGEFNFSAINNFGASLAHGEYLLLLNNDTEVITPDWLQEMLMFAQRPDVGAVGAMLYYPDNTVQHAGLVLGIDGIAGHIHYGYPRGSLGYIDRLVYAQNVSGVTGACMMIPKKLYEELGGLDERLRVAYNDVDFCIRIRNAGYLIVFTPFAELYHCESKTRGYEDTVEKQNRFYAEGKLLRSLWGDVLDKGDPYYNPNIII